MTTSPPPHGQYPEPPVDPAIQAAQENRKTVIWGVSIFVFGPIIAAALFLLLILFLCCGGCAGLGIIGQGPNG